jgi:ubiquinone biosynthesis protein UbiJ
MADEPDNLALELLRRIDAKAERIADDQASMKADIAAIKTEQRVHSRLLDILKQDGRLLRSAVNDIVKENVTPGEIEAVHQELTQVQRDVVSLQVRVEQIEEREKSDH